MELLIITRSSSLARFCLGSVHAVGHAFLSSATSSLNKLLRGGTYASTTLDVHEASVGHTGHGAEHWISACEMLWNLGFPLDYYHVYTKALHLHSFGFFTRAADRPPEAVCRAGYSKIIYGDFLTAHNHFRVAQVEYSVPKTLYPSFHLISDNPLRARCHLFLESLRR